MMAYFEGSAPYIVGYCGSFKSVISDTVLKNIAPELMESSDTVYAQSDLNIEEIMKLNPDVILYNAGNSSHAEILKASGIPSIGFATVGASTEADPLERYEEWLKLLEDIFGEPGKTEAFVAAGDEIVADVEARIADIPESDLRRAVVLRADIDALPIREQSGAAWSSENDGVMHACGHDIHAAVLYGTLLRLSAERNFEGTLFGIFQPGEESNPGGASKVLAENPFEGYTVLAVVGEHVEPALDAGTLGFRAGKYMASNDELRLTLEGAGGHAAMRAEHRDTVSAAAQLILHLTALNTPERVVSIGKVEAAGATNVIPDRVYMEGTMRTFDERERAEVKRRIEELAAANDASYGVRTRVHFTPGYPCVVNDPELIRQAVALAETEGIPFQMLPLRMTSEDFGFYGTRYPAIFYRLGVGPGAGKLHTSTFNPDEAAIPTGIRFMELLARNYFNR
jgi:amidohydrolase